jgi:hypothetical protein
MTQREKLIFTSNFHFFVSYLLIIVGRGLVSITPNNMVKVKVKIGLSQEADDKLIFGVFVLIKQFETAVL